MENQPFSIPIEATISNSITMDGISSSFVQSDMNHQMQMMSGFPLFPPTFQGEPSDDFHDQFSGGNLISATELSTLLATRSSLHENVNNETISAQSAFPHDLPDFVSYDCSTTSNSSLESFCSPNSTWDFHRFFSPQESTGKSAVGIGFQPLNLHPNGWLSSSSKVSNELSLSLATTQTCNTEEHSLSFNSYAPANISQLFSGSRYLHVIQEILAEIARYSVENIDQSGGFGIGFHDDMGSGDFTDGIDPIFQTREIEAKKAQMLALLQLVDNRYNQCLDEIHTVISAFHAATELEPQIHARFAMQAVSFMYKNLRERISNTILAMGSNFDYSECTRGKENRSFDNSFIQKQWALQQLKRKDHQLWRPQRGLPERSVSVLRAWMFQNFLHPYPKDAEKHLLSIKSGLTRSQVSNWFINARVRLWKPLIEEMYSDMKNRKSRHNGVAGQSHRSHVNITDDHHRLRMD